MRAEVLKGHLDALLLATVESGAQYGYAIRESLRADSGGRFDLPTGTIYPALYRLERAGLIAGKWAKAGVKRQRRYYELTVAGRRELANQRTSWQEFATAMSSVLLQGRTWPASA